MTIRWGRALPVPCRAVPGALQNGDTPLQLAICGGGYDQRGKMDSMELLISHGANVELPNRVRLALSHAGRLPKEQARERLAALCMALSLLVELFISH